MALNFKKLGEVTLVTKTTNTTNVLIEENGEIKRVAKTEVGGASTNTAIIKSSDYYSAISTIVSGGGK